MKRPSLRPLSSPTAPTAGVFTGLLVAATAAVILAACADAGTQTTDPVAVPAVEGTHAHHTMAAVEPSAASVSEASTPAQGSLYVLGHSWTDQEGRSLTLADLAGRPRVIAMVYTHCTYACPLILAQMKQIEAAFTDVDPARAPGFVLVSIDPERDTAERLADFAASMRLAPGRWTLLTGSEDAVLELSVLLGVKYRATDGGDFAHSNVLTVLDTGGRVVTRVEGLNSDLAAAVVALEALVGT